MQSIVVDQDAVGRLESLKFALRLAPTRPVGGIPGLQNKKEHLMF